MYQCIYVFLTVIASVYSQPLVDTTHGKVAGKVLRTLLKDVEYYAFMGIPYAARPVHTFRFMAPQPIQTWDGILNATKYKEPCYQFKHVVKTELPFSYFGAEDCLYLNIFTPATDENNRPIIVFLENSRFRYSLDKSDYGPDFFIEEDVIIITINYRMTLFGFLSLEDDIIPGNAGLKDIVAGLEWIKNNAVYFGGDPKRITLMGSQGGAAAADLLIHSPANQLFNSVILQSGTSWSTMYLQENVRDRAFRLAELTGTTTSSSKRLLEILRDISPETLLAQEIAANPKDYTKEHQRSALTFGPVVETHPDSLVREYPERVSKRNTPVLIGFNSREGLEPALQYLIEPKYLSFLEKDFPLLLPRRVEFKFDPDSDSYFEAVKEVKKFYFDGKVKISSVPEYVTYIGDVLTGFAVHAMAEKYANISSRSVFYYQFDYYSALSENKNNLLKLSSVSEGTSGAAAGDELCYLFLCPKLRKKYAKYYKQQTEEINVSQKLVRMWSNFAKHGNPTPEGDTVLDLKWPPYTETKEYLHINKQLEVRNSINSRFRFWARFIGKWRAALRGTVANKDEL
ncbi:juvenile hormone esterase-like isoform X1 [Leguminivora glycinivorella]|uniref:juvenile hormone esterase-like isoform X1 n=1 Tax=Leguminivora glycinivorella TaxID=1035111 RepID=UPI00201081E0|nr:juvenile hormone esterase-like isoform X1 [Leguminivora glycinivorella]